MVDLERLERALLAAARGRRPVTYGQLLALFERRLTPITVRALCRDLGKVCERVAARGGPDLAVLVVRKSDGLPGEGYFAALREADGYAGPASGARAARLVRRRQRLAYAWAAAQAARGMAAADPQALE
jgi:hypothetical protein